MEILSDRLTRELMERGNLPISAEGVVRLRPDIVDELSAEQSLLAEEIEDRSGDGEDVDAGSCEGLLEARDQAALAGAAPGDPPLAVDPLEVANEQHAEVDARR